MDSPACLCLSSAQSRLRTMLLGTVQCVLAAGRIMASVTEVQRAESASAGPAWLGTRVFASHIWTTAMRFINPLVCVAHGSNSDSLSVPTHLLARLRAVPGTRVSQIWLARVSQTCVRQTGPQDPVPCVAKRSVLMWPMLPRDAAKKLVNGRTHTRSELPCLSLA